MKNVKPIFTPGKYYVAMPDNTVQQFDTIEQAKYFAYDDDVILVALTSNGSHIAKSSIIKADKITVDFNKNLLTIEGKGVTLNKIEYKTGVSSLTETDLKEWYKLLNDAYIHSQAVEIVGTPPINGKDITDEMSDL